MATDVLDMSTLVLLGLLAEACEQGRRIRWAVGGNVANITSGMAWAFTDEQGGLWRGDVRDAWVWISGTVEYFLPVREALELMKYGLLVVD